MNHISPNASIAATAVIGDNVTIREGVIIEDNVTIGDNCYIDYHAIMKENVSLGDDGFVGTQCIWGEFPYDFFAEYHNPLVIGTHALLRSGSILYGDSVIGDYL